ncbi:UNVERIFIED_CONTAM: hypothetical protein GTU68_008356 [Idotea baltica]|nr:hypothetical protein [Idotea baltica]
MLYWTQSLLA